MRRYYTCLLPQADEVTNKTFAGAGWSAKVSRTRSRFGEHKHFRNEIVIHAPSWDRAQAALSQILDAFVLFERSIEWGDDYVAVPADNHERHAKLDQFMEGRKELSISGLVDACRVAAVSSRNRNLAYSLALFRLSAKIHSNNPMDLAPNKYPYRQRSASLYDQVRFAYSIVTCYAVLETLGLALHNEAFKNGMWIPEKRADLEARLAKSGVYPRKQILWCVRGGRTKLEKARTLPQISKVDWTRYPVRDCTIDLVEAIGYLRWLRARAAAHDIKNLSSLLSVHNVANAQDLVRHVLFDVLRKMKALSANDVRI